MLRFLQDACVQCGLCKATWGPKGLITLTPQLDFRAAPQTPACFKEEEAVSTAFAAPKAFGVKSTIDRVTAKLEGKSTGLFKGQAQRPRRAQDVARDCRVGAVMEQDFDPYAGPPRTALVAHHQDLFREREERKREEKKDT